MSNRTNRISPYRGHRGLHHHRTEGDTQVTHTDIINRQTGKSPTNTEWERIKFRALQIFRSPYASPQQVAWAVDMYPEGFAESFVLSPYQQKRQDWRLS